MKSDYIEDFRDSIELLYEGFFSKIDRERGVVLPASADYQDHPGRPGIILHLPFTNVSQALGSLDEVTRCAQRYLNAGTDTIEDTDVETLKQLAEEWLEGFDALQNTLKADPTFEGHTELILIRIHGLVTQIQATVPRSEMEYDQHAPIFEKIAELVQECLDNSKHIVQDRKYLSWGMVLINPIFFVATKCRLYHIRSRLLQTLSKMKMIEGPWASCTAYQIASRLSMMEFKNVPDVSGWLTIPEADRIRLCLAYFEDKTNVTIVYKDAQFKESPVLKHEVFMVRPSQQQATMNQV